MKTEHIGDMWVSFANEDLTEGRGALRPIAHCQIEATAKRMSLGEDVQGTDATVTKLPMLQVKTEDNNRKYAYIYGPVHLTRPDPIDIQYQKELDEKRKVTEKAKELGLTEDEIKILRG